MNFFQIVRLRHAYILIAIHRLSIFFISLGVTLVFFWLVGNFQQFLDSTMITLLKLWRFSMLGLSCVAFVGLLMTIIIRIRVNFYRSIVYYCICLIIALSLSIVSIFLLLVV